jgi:hypothetical protein
VQRTLFRARWLAPAILLALTACSQPTAQARLEAHQAAVDLPRLWRVQALDPHGAVTAELLVCADETLRAGFGRANAEANGRPCLPMRDGVERPGLYAVRCELDGRRFGLTVTRTGDDQDFTAAFALRALDGSGLAARQVRRYSRLGPCPEGWIIGDQARLGSPRGVNALAGTWGSP